MLGLLRMLFGGNNRYKICCPQCGKEGGMYTKGGTVEGIFEVIGKTEDGGLSIKECPQCKTALGYDSLTTKVHVREPIEVNADNLIRSINALKGK